MSFETKYKQQMNSINFTVDFEKSTVELMESAAKRKGENVMNKTTKTLVAAVLIIAILSFTAFAISKLLSAGEVAEHFGESQVADSFNEQNSEVKSVTDKGYTVSFLGIIKGEKFESEEIKSDCSYYVVSVAASDGSTLSLVEGNPLGMSVIIEGYPAWKINTWSLNTSANGMESNGILYYLYDCENLEIFADKNVYLAVYEGFTPGIDIITMNSDGTFKFAEGYNGFKAMFKIPLDPLKANPEAANEILREYLAEENTTHQDNDTVTDKKDEPQSSSKKSEASKTETSKESVYETQSNNISESEDELIPESDMEPMPNYKDKWTVSSGF